MLKNFVRKATSPEDQLGFQQCMATAFVYSYDSENFKPHVPEEGKQPLSETWVNGEGRVTSGYVVHDFDCWFDGQIARTSGIGGVASLPEGRGQGGIRSIFEAQLPDSYEKGFLFSILFPFSHVFYRKFGYELIQRTKEYDIAIASLKPFVDDAPAKLITDAKEIQEIHNAFGSTNNLTIRRKEGQWHFVSKDPVKSVNYTYKIGEEGFVTFRKEDIPDGGSYKIFVRDLAYSSLQGLRSILGFFYCLRAQYSRVHLCLPDSVPFMDMIAECYDPKVTVGAHGMARIVNVHKVLEMKAYTGSGSYTVTVSDEQIPENNGTFCVTYAPDGVSVSKVETSEPSDITATIQRLTQLVLGSLTIDELSWLDGITCTDPDKIRAIFTKKDFFFNDPF